MTYAIEAQGLRKSFGAHEVVRGVDLAIRQGELFTLLGPNGAGKTTTIQMLTTMLLPDGGTARICGCDVVAEAVNVRRRISVTGQYAALDESLTGWQNLTLFAGLHGYTRKESRALAAELLESFRLTDAAGRSVGSYSGGMRRRLDLAAGIVSQPEVMFLDEPTTGLDPQSRRELWELVRRLVKNGTTVLLTTQYLEEADKLADRIGFIAQGKIIATGTPKRLKASIGSKTLTIRPAEGADPGDICKLLASEHGLKAYEDEDGQVVRMAVRDAALAHVVISTLFDHATAIDDFALSEPTLDDVYFALTAARGKEVAS
ncbi:daunorubicin resistance protein DrrA family ABC transporter ATP-binding protein [Paenibacillus sp. 598K]|uniref:ATP-binding cassette domain-containing protein n=1 Tax=Paenibacillus sp. 598K TaxID=1117987 RepID=UPI000FFAAA88|nr:ATP-binding cassette domain-containing protein [Paenibacillus sp. 598K]GBF75680.1 daunorubicin resistance protein DrrA family ABC transporter ATP-binding protein [Paenibacillus sp. 598K]